MRDVLSADEITTGIAETGLEGWWFGDGALHARFATGGFATGLEFVNRVGEVADAVDHHPDLDLRFSYVDVHTHSHDVGGVTRRDLRLAARVAEVAGALGLRAGPAAAS